MSKELGIDYHFQEQETQQGGWAWPSSAQYHFIHNVNVAFSLMCSINLIKRIGKNHCRKANV